MEPNPCRIEANTALDSVRTACRSMVSVITSAAEKKKLKLSKRKQEFAPTSCTNSPATLGATISDPCCACDINPFTAISPAIGTSVRTATDCAGTKKAETTLIVNRMTYITYRSCTNTSASTSTPDQIAGNHRPLQVPPIHEDAGQRA